MDAKYNLAGEEQILVVLMGSLGDLIRGLSILKPIKAQYPKVKVSWVVDEKWLSLIENHPFIDKVFVFKRKPVISNFQRLRKELKEQDFDYVLDLQRIAKSGLLSLVTGSKVRIGFNPKNSKELNYLFNTTSVAQYPQDEPKIIHYHKFIELLGVSTSEPYDSGFEYLKSDKNSVSAENENVAFILESTWDSKNWFDKYYLEFAKLLIAQNPKIKVHLFGTANVIKLADRIAAEFPQKVQNHVNKTSLKELAAHLAQMNWCVGPDSGPGHLAAAFNTPYYTLFGPTDPKRVAPYGQEQNALRVSVPCSPCNRKKCPGLGKVCMQALTPQYVLDLILAKQK